MLVTREYIRQCDLNLTRARTFKGELQRCYSRRLADAGASSTKDQTIKVLTADNKRKDQRISQLESRWSFIRSFSAGAAAASCTVFALSMVDDASTAVRVVSGTGCVVGGVLVLKW